VQTSILRWTEKKVITSDTPHHSEVYVTYKTMQGASALAPLVGVIPSWVL